MHLLAHELISAKVPKIFVLQLMLTYRYISVLIEETSNMITAYHMRSPRQKRIEMSYMGTFAGQLLLRSFGKADHIYDAMKCKGFDGEYRFATSDGFKAKNWTFAILLAGSFILMRAINVSLLLGNLIQL